MQVNPLQFVHRNEQQAIDENLRPKEILLEKTVLKEQRYKEALDEISKKLVPANYIFQKKKKNIIWVHFLRQITA